MTGVQASVIDAAGCEHQQACDIAGCERLAEMRRCIELLQKQNRELQGSIAELDHLASTDKLTGAWNRRRLEESVDHEMDRLKRYGHALSLLVIDVDFFKRINDRHGHAMGDRLLVELAAQIRSVLRASDALTRWGGEEFLVLCPDTALATAAILAERLRMAVARMGFSTAEGVTVSIGVAECLPDDTWKDWFGRADAKLLEAKSGGRNQVRIACEAPVRGGIEKTDPAKFVHLVWHRNYESGQETVDREHQMLFGDANDLLEAILAGRPERETGGIVDRLIQDVVQHFRDEESIITAAGYPDAARHAALHRDLASRADALITRFRAREASVGEMFQFLAHDVIAKHMLGADRDFFPYLKGPPETAERRTEALLQA